MSVPRKIFTIWLGGEMPDWIKECVKTHHIPGYEHRYIDEDYAVRGPFNSKYFTECIEAKKWAKAADYLRIKLLYYYGGIYLDADVTVLEEQNFDDLLGSRMFCGREKNNFVSNAIIGSEAGHPILKKYLDTVESNFIGSGDLVYQPGMYLWTEYIHNATPEDGVTVYPDDYFLPFCWQDGIMNQTNNTRCIHWFNKSWV